MKIGALVLLSILTLNRPVENKGVYVLCYHTFNGAGDRFSFNRAELKGHLDFFEKQGYNFVSVSDIKEDRIQGDKNILISIDDGSSSVYKTYFSVLKPRNIRPLLAIYPGIIGKKKNALTWKELKELSDSGCDIASHGYSHLHLNKRLYSSRRKDFDREIYGSKEILEQRLGRRIDIFVYPFGTLSDITVAELKKAGYRYAFTVYSGRLDIAGTSNQEPHRLPRYLMTRVNWRTAINQIIRDRVSHNTKYALKPIKTGKF